MQFISRSILALTLVLMAFCAPPPGNKDAYQPNSENCSSQFISDYNDIVYKARAVSTEAELATLERSVEVFATKYKDVKCKANLKSLDSPNSEETEKMIDANEWTAKLSQATSSMRQAIQRAIDKATTDATSKKQNPSPYTPAPSAPSSIAPTMPTLKYPGNPIAYATDSQDCSETFVNAVSALADDLATKIEQLANHEVLDGMINDFATKYKDVECYSYKRIKEYPYLEKSLVKANELSTRFRTAIVALKETPAPVEPTPSNP